MPLYKSKSGQYISYDVWDTSGNFIEVYAKDAVEAISILESAGMDVGEIKSIKPVSWTIFG